MRQFDQKMKKGCLLVERSNIEVLELFEGLELVRELVFGPELLLLLYLFVTDFVEFVAAGQIAAGSFGTEPQIVVSGKLLVRFVEAQVVCIALVEGLVEFEEMV